MILYLTKGKGLYMNKKINKLILLSIFILTLFFKVNTVNAQTTDCTYGAVCTYEFCGRRSVQLQPGNLSVSCPNNSGNVILNIAFRCYDKDTPASSCKSFYSWARAAKNNGTSHQNIEWDNYDETFNNVDHYSLAQPNSPNTIKARFNKDGKVNCLSLYATITTSFTNGTGDNRYRFSFRPDGGKMVSLTKTTCISKEQTNDEITSQMESSCAEQANKASQRTTTPSESSGSSSGDSTCDETCQKIINWAKAEGYNTTSKVGDPCNAISGTVTKILQSIFMLISVVGIILLVAMTSISFVKAIVASDDNKIKDAAKSLKTRIIVIIILLVLPVLLSFIINIVNSNSNGKIKIGSDGKVFCDVTS